MTVRRTAVLVVVIALGLALASPVAAQTYTGGNVPTVGRTDSGPAGSASQGAGGRTATAQGFAPVRLALSGGDVLGLVALGLVLVGVGTAAVRGSRRRTIA